MRFKIKKKYVYQTVAVTLWLTQSLLTGCKDSRKDQAPEIEPDATVIMGRMGCFGCHTQDGSGFRGPSFKGLVGRTSILKSGDTIVVDEAYIRKSILEPSADQVLGYPFGLMPKTNLSQKQLDLVVEYLMQFKHPESK